MTKIPESPTISPDPWHELEESVYLATACIRLLADLAAREIRQQDMDKDAACTAAGLMMFSSETSAKLLRAFRAVHGGGG